MTKAAPKVRARAPRPKKSDQTRELVLQRALALFRKHGVDGTTMRDIARATGLSLGAAYYYFPSKEALLLAYYEANQATIESRLQALPRPAGLRAALGQLLHTKLDTLGDDRPMLAAVARRLMDPSDPVSAFSDQSRAVRTRAIAMFEQALADQPLDAGARALAAQLLWLLHMGCLLYFVNDDSPGQTRTRRLVDDALDLIVPLIGLAGSPVAAPLLAAVQATLARAGLDLR